MLAVESSGAGLETETVEYIVSLFDSGTQLEKEIQKPDGPCSCTLHFCSMLSIAVGSNSARVEESSPRGPTHAKALMKL